MKVYYTDKIITRDKIRKNPDVLYLFGDNYIRKGLGGQAKEMRGEPNTIGIVTKKYPNNNPSSFLRDEDFLEWLEIFNKDKNKIQEALETDIYKAIVVPPIGVGLAKLPEKAPKIWKELSQFLTNISTLKR